MKFSSNVIKVFTGFIVVKPESGTDVRAWQPAKKIYCFIGNTSISVLKDEYELDIGSVLVEKINLVWADLP